MTQEEIQILYQFYVGIKELMEQKIKDLQKECPHTNKENVGWADDHDGYSMVEINSWEKFKCPDCHKYWNDNFKTHNTYG